ncbi:expressed unknown protein [Seminavis robusta]|uniref:Uncharacterized protein n=1 Tax=Seminavis robusta TaxID=568900 RepID=A0A9N8E5S6_9STRA|nr:expressed unknown protein [Seminavis robusta]|eukprot:Sro545_g163800.1 n/a (242) ;mRNA; r:9769-10494
MFKRIALLLCLLVLAVQPVGGFQALLPSPTSLTLLSAKKKKKSGGGGGFGSSKPSANSKPKPLTISADKNALEKQWDTFVSITDLEIRPKGDEKFEVVDIFVRSGVENSGANWFRIGKVCAEGENCSTDAALTLQKGLIFWTAVHMKRELVAAGGKSGAASLELGYTASSMNVGSESDGPIGDEEDGLEIMISERVSVKDVAPGSFGFRPDWNPPGFTYKRREKDALKKKKGSTLDEIVSL